MKILIVLIRWKGGVGRVVNSIKPLLEKAGHQVEVISREDDLNCYSLKQSFFKLRKEIRKRDYDILYVMDWSCALPLLTKKNMFVGFMGMETINPLFQKLISVVKRDKVIVLSDNLKKKFPKSNLIYMGVDKKLFKDIGNKRIKDSVGFINWHKEEDYHYETVKRIVKELKMKFIEEPIEMSSSIEEIINLLNSIEILVTIPTGSPGALGYNLTILEAMACGVPKIISNLGKDFNINYISNIKDLKEMLKNAKKTNYKINPEFDWDIHTTKLMGVFNEKSA